MVHTPASPASDHFLAECLISSIVAGLFPIPLFSLPTEPASELPLAEYNEEPLWLGVMVAFPPDIGAGCRDELPKRSPGGGGGGGGGTGTSAIFHETVFNI